MIGPSFILHPSWFFLFPFSFRRGVLLGEQRASKTRGQGSNPCTPADLRLLPLECDGIARDPPKVADQVRLLARALFQPLLASVTGARRCSKPQGRVRFPGGGFSRYQVLGV